VCVQCGFQQLTAKVKWSGVGAAAARTQLLSHNTNPGDYVNFMSTTRLLTLATAEGGGSDTTVRLQLQMEIHQRSSRRLYSCRSMLSMARQAFSSTVIRDRRSNCCKLGK
jgi:hypothetical protein